MKTQSQPSKSVFGALALIATAAACAAETTAVPPAPSAPPAAAAPATVLSKEQASYLLGLDYGNVMRNYDINTEIASDELYRGFKDGLAGKRSTAADKQHVKEYIARVQSLVAQIHAAAAQEFLSRNRRQQGVTTSASGLQYKILDAGDPQGTPPQPEDRVSVQYRGTLLDGTEFDSTYTSGTPASFPVNAVIQGWQEALVLMKPGAKWQLYIPPDLGYGKAPRPGIPGNSVLVFEVELLKVIPGTAPSPTPGN